MNFFLSLVWTLVPLVPQSNLLVTLALAPAHIVESVRGWSLWRRRRQHHARACHYRRRDRTLNPEMPLQVLTGLRPSPTSHAVVGFRISRRLTQGPAVSTADHYHSLRLGLLTMTRSAYLQVRCAVVALWSEHQAPYAL